MPHPRLHRIRHALAGLLLAFAALLASVPSLRAQPCTEEPCNEFPTIALTPGSASTSQPGGVPVTITARDRENGLDTLSFAATLNGQDVSDQFSITREDYPVAGGIIEVRYIFRWTVPLSRQAPVASLVANICDTGNRCTEFPAQGTYTLAIPGVEVGARGLAVTLGRAATRTRPFTVTNRGTVAATFLLAPSCREAETGSAVTPCTVSPSSVTLPPGGAQEATVTYGAMQVDIPLVVALSARQADQPTVRDAGWVDVTLFGGSGGVSAPAVRLVDLNSGAQVERAQCVTVAAGPDAAYECGDLRLVHPLPSITTVGRTRTPVLIYNSQHAHPRPLVYADVTVPSGASAPDSMVATVTLGDGTVIRRAWPGTQWRPGITRRVAVQWDGLQTATGVYPYSLQVAARYGANSHFAPVQNGQLAVVNRGGSPFGAGWWLAGLEQITCMDCPSGGSRILWIGGDGSTRIYEPPVPGAWGTWTAQRPDGPPDTLTLTAPGGVARYTRRLRGGGEIHYDGVGRHVRTVSRLGHVTSFAYDSAGRLQAVYPPTAREALWWFNRDPATGRLLNVRAHVVGTDSRYVGVELNATTGRITGLQDPDGAWVRFGYGSSTGNRVLTRTDRRGTVTRYEYDGAGRLASAKVPLAAGDTIVTRFTAGESRGIGTSIALADAYTLLDGPRTDVDDHTRIWVGRWGAPVRIRDAVGAETRIRRGDPAFPALATEVATPGGLRTEARYDARGRVDTTVVYNPLDDGRNALTTYAYDNRWDAPTRTTTFEVAANGAVTQLVGTSYAEYDSVTGNVVSQRLGEGTARQATFRYYGPGSGLATGLPRAVQAPADAQGQVAVDSLWYDEQGNLKGTRSPLGFLTLRYRDLLGRDTLAIAPIDSATARDTAALKLSGTRQRTTYDVMDRVRRAETIGPARTYSSNYNQTFTPAPTPEQRLVVETEYDAEGAPRTVSRWAAGNESHTFVTEFEYDSAGRKVREFSTQDGWKTFTYDHGGNVLVARTPRLFEIRMQYDAVGRLTHRTVPAVSYGTVCDQTHMLTACEPFPRFPNAGGGYAIPEEWTYFRYDSAGSQVYAENADAIVLRSHYRGGAMRTDSTHMRAYTGSDFTQHQYGLEYGYDVAGRVRWMRHPTSLAQSGAQVDSFSYEAVTGALERMRDRQGHRFTWTYDNAGLLRTLEMPGPVTETMSYDRAGRLFARTEAGPLAGTLHRDTLRYDARDRIILAHNGPSIYQQWYNGLGALEANDWQNLDSNVLRITDQYRTDPLGNVVWRKTSRDAPEMWPGEYPEYENHYDPTAGRLLWSQKIWPANPPASWVPDSTARAYDLSGNVVHGYRWVGKRRGDGTITLGQEEETRSWYSADDRLVAMQKYGVRNTGEDEVSGVMYYEHAGVWEEYRYDALGRRILVRTRADGGICEADAWTCASSITRFVWAGDQLLWELRAPGQSGASLESTSGSGAAYGRVSYTHGGGIDRPLVITKGDTSIVPHQNWRGAFAMGTYADGPDVGRVSDCGSFPAQNCVPIQWPGERTTVYHELTPDRNIQNWFGSLVDDMRDATGQMYRRNRYYDPQTGQFTQPDPIGLAGGLNAYGFAEGDPVSYSDPYGLFADTTRRQALLMDNGAIETVPWYESPEFYVATLGAGWVGSKALRAVIRRGRSLLGREPELQPFDTNNPLSTFSREYVTEGGTVIDVQVQAVTQGRTLRVQEIAVYRRGGDAPGSLGVSTMRRIFRTLEAEAKQRGYERIEGVAHRTKDGRTVRIDADLKE